MQVLSDSNSTRPPGQNPTRREFLAGVAKLSALGALSLSALLPPTGNISSQPGPGRPAVYPNAARAALIEKWQERIEETIDSLDSLQSFLSAARFLAPADVDAERFYDLEGESLNAIDDLSRDMQMIEFDELGAALTGSRSYLVIIKKEIREGQMSRERLQAEIDRIRQDCPTDAGVLQAMLDSHYGGAA